VDWAPPGWLEFAGDEPLAEALARSKHPRIVGEAFLERATSRLLRFHAYWESKRVGRKMPARADLDPVEFVDLMPDIVLADVLGTAPFLRYRLVGTRQVELRGRDPTGQPVIGNHIGHHRHDALAHEVALNYRCVVERGVAVYNFNTVDGPMPDSNSFAAGALRERATLLLPLSSDGRTVDMAFCCTDLDTVG
jgi:hypothetical protein